MERKIPSSRIQAAVILHALVPEHALVVACLVPGRSPTDGLRARLHMLQRSSPEPKTAPQIRVDKDELTRVSSY